MTTQENVRALNLLRIAAFMVPAVIALILLAAGTFFIGRPWAVPVLCAGFFGLFAVGLGKWQESAVLGTYGFMLIVATGVFWLGFTFDDSPWRFICIVGGAAGAMVSGLAAMITLQVGRLLGDEGGMVDAQVLQLKRIQETLDKIQETMLITDAARKALFHETEVGLLRRRVDEMIARGDYDGALDFCDAVEKAFESAEEAETFRHRVLRSRQEHHEMEIHGALEQFDRLLMMRDWAHAHQEAARIRRRYPESDFLPELDKRIHAAREAHKQELMGRFNDATGRDDVDRSMALLKELDRYLTRDEAAVMAERAQQIVERHRDNLSTRFKMAVNDHRWREAIEIGDLIKTEFPNSKMAEEVNSMIDVLRNRATEGAAAPPGAGAGLGG